MKKLIEKFHTLEKDEDIKAWIEEAENILETVQPSKKNIPNKADILELRYRIKLAENILESENEEAKNFALLITNDVAKLKNLIKEGKENSAEYTNSNEDMKSKYATMFYKSDLPAKYSDIWLISPIFSILVSNLFNQYFLSFTIL